MRIPETERLHFVEAPALRPEVEPESGHRWLSLKHDRVGARTEPVGRNHDIALVCIHRREIGGLEQWQVGREYKKTIRTPQNRLLATGIDSGVQPDRIVCLHHKRDERLTQLEQREQFALAADKHDRVRNVRFQNSIDNVYRHPGNDRAPLGGIEGSRESRLAAVQSPDRDNDRRAAHARLRNARAALRTSRASRSRSFLPPMTVWLTCTS